MPYLLGLDIGSSSIKASLLDIDSGVSVASAYSPETEMQILSPMPGYAEQDPMTWWEHVVIVSRKLANMGFDLSEVKAIGISYQMHGLVLVDHANTILRPAIIWCDSRAVEVGVEIVRRMGPELCLSCLNNLPGNFTSSRLLWIKHHEPELYVKIHKAMLPGEFIGMMLTGEIVTTRPGLSEAMFLDFDTGEFAYRVYDDLGMGWSILPDMAPTFGFQGEVTRDAAEATGLKPCTPVTYRAGDQLNNALSLGVLEPDEAATTAGTSGVIFVVTDENPSDALSRFNVFAHVNYQPDAPRQGALLCVNGTGSMYRWLKQNVCMVRRGGGESLTYEEMNALASTVPIGSDGLVILPFGNGAERVLSNRDLGASVHNLTFNTHTIGHIIRAANEGIVFALNYGAEILRSSGIGLKVVRSGNTNMFQSGLFCEAFANTVGATLELYNTDGSQGAARGAGIGAGIYTFDNAFRGLEKVDEIHPNKALSMQYGNAYNTWLEKLNMEISNA
jgi:xylulokinase